MPDRLVIPVAQGGRIFHLVKEPLIKSHRGRCGKNWPRVRRLRGRIPAVGCNREANTEGPRATPRSQKLCGLWLGSPQPRGLKPFVDLCLAVSRRPRPSDFFAGHIVSLDTRCCGVARLGETAAGIDSLTPARLALSGLPPANLPKPLPQLRVAQHSRLQNQACGHGHGEVRVAEPIRAALLAGRQEPFKSANDLQRPSWDLISVSLMTSERKRVGLGAANPP